MRLIIARSSVRVRQGPPTYKYKMKPEIIEWNEFKNMNHEDPGNVNFEWNNNEDVLLLTEKGMKANYPIDYDRFETPLQLIGWLDHLLSKVWFNGRDAQRLIRIVCDKRGWEYHGI